MSYLLSCSIVAYRNDLQTLNKTIQSVLDTSINIILYLYDNSPNQNIKSICIDSRIIYIHTGENVGFGKGHNYCIKDASEKSKYHLILNPDVYFVPGTLEKLIDRLEEDNTIGVISPKVLYPDGKIQFSCRQLPSPFHILVRRLSPFKNLFASRIAEYDLAFTNYNQTMEVPFLLGCFLMIPMKVLKEVGTFDETFFMYMEDFDLARRIKKKYKTIFFPEAQIYHVYERGSVKSLKLIFYHISSAFKYFNKWGWFVDKERDSYNEAIIKQFCS